MKKKQDIFLPKTMNESDIIPYYNLFDKLDELPYPTYKMFFDINNEIIFRAEKQEIFDAVCKKHNISMQTFIEIWDYIEEYLSVKPNNEKLWT